MNAENEIARFLANAKHLEDNHAYSPEQEHDACGVGLVAAIDGKPRRAVVLGAIEALKSVWHRGAVDADGKTGDGAGIHLQVPQDFFRAQVEHAGPRLRSGRIAVGQIFLPRTDYAAQETCRTIVESEILRSGFHLYGWRQVPIDISIIGEKANLTRPRSSRSCSMPATHSTSKRSTAASISAAAESRRACARPRSRTSMSVRSPRVP